MGIRYDRLAIIINRLRKEEGAAFSELKADTGADYLVSLPEDPELSETGENGKNLWSIPPTNPVVERLDDFLSSLGAFEASRLNSRTQRL